MPDQVWGKRMTDSKETAGEVLKQLGPGLITGAADDDPSGIATYSQAGAQFGFNMLWTVLLALPLMIAIQSIAGRIGAVTGKGLAANLKRVIPEWMLTLLVLLLLVANIINIAADVSAMGAAAKLLAPHLPVDVHVYIVAFGILSLVLQVVLSYERYVFILKWLTLALLSYVAVLFVVHTPWSEVAMRTILPRFTLDKTSITLIVAVLGTTISPYLFFWQSGQEVEEIDDHPANHALKDERPARARKEIRRIGIDTIVGMVFSEAVAFAIILTTAVTLNAHGQTNINSAADAAEALRPIAGDFAATIFAIGIIGTGLLAIPVLAGSAAYAVAETGEWPHGLNKKVMQAKAFYFIIAVAVLGGVALSFSPIDPIKALVWAAVVNGVAAVPIMAVTMLVVVRKDIMGVLTATRLQVIFRWLATGVMGVAAVAMVATNLM